MRHRNVRHVDMPDDRIAIDEVRVVWYLPESESQESVLVHHQMLIDRPQVNRIALLTHVKHTAAIHVGIGPIVNFLDYVLLNLVIDLDKIFQVLAIPYQRTVVLCACHVMLHEHSRNYCLLVILVVREGLVVLLHLKQSFRTMHIGQQTHHSLFVEHIVRTRDA